MKSDGGLGQKVTMNITAVQSQIRKNVFTLSSTLMFEPHLVVFSDYSWQVQRTIWVSEDQTQVSCVQDMRSTWYTIDILLDCSYPICLEDTGAFCDTHGEKGQVMEKRNNFKTIKIILYIVTHKLKIYLNAKKDFIY